METTNCEDRINFCVKSRLRQRKFVLKWTLENFSKYESSKYVHSSPFFLVQDKVGFTVQLCRYGKTLEAFLNRHLSGVQVSIKYNVTVTDGKDKLWYSSSDIFNIGSNSQVCIVNEVECCREENNDKEDTVEITLALEMDEIKTEEFYKLPTPETFVHDVHTSFSRDIARLLDDQMATDVTLRVGEDTVGAHKTILSARSPVFAKLFQHDTEEPHSSEVDIQDVEMSAIKELLDFMYSKARFNYDFTTALDVYYVADKYEVMQLREICGPILVSHLDKGNAGCVLRLADRHGDKELKKRTMTFINSNLKSCIKSNWWKEIMSERSSLTSELETFIADTH